MFEVQKMNLRTKKLFSWGLISFLTTTAITYVFVGNWFQTIFIATILVLLEIFELAFLERKQIVKISCTSRVILEEMVRK